MLHKTICLLIVFVSFFSCFQSLAQEHKPDTVTVGIYVTSIHDIDFRQKEYGMNLWLWLKYKKPEFDFMRNLEVPMAKSFEKSYATLDTLDDGRMYMLMKLECRMKGIWRIEDFPFDRQRLRFTIENSMYDSRELVFVADTGGEHYGKYFLMAWEKEAFDITTGIKEYETSFGDPSLAKPYSEYSSYRVNIIIHRQSWELFLKLFLGMYISFLIAAACLYIHPDNMDSRLTLGVGSLFAVIGNKYIIDSTLPESTTFTLVDILHGLTLLYIFLVIALSIYNMKLFRKDELKSEKFNQRTRTFLLLLYLALNVFFIIKAYTSEVAQM